MSYDDLVFKIPHESPSYKEDSEFVIRQIMTILDNRRAENDDKIMDQELKAICGNAIDELKRIRSNSVNLIVTDPPYNLNKDYGNNQDELEFEDYLQFSREWLSEAKRILTDDGTIYVFMGMRYISYIY